MPSRPVAASAALSVVVPLALATAPPLAAQAAGRWPPDSLVNTLVIPRSTPPIQVIGTMRDFASALGVRCQFCHVGEEGMPLERFDFPSDRKRTKQVARQMMRMVEEINRRVDTLPREDGHRPAAVSCVTCHHGVSRPVPLPVLIAETAIAAGADSAVRAYRALRERYFGGDAYDFREPSLNVAAFRAARAGRFDDALTLLRYNEELFPGSPSMAVFRGNIELLRADTAAAEAAFREALRRNPSHQEAMARLRGLGRQP